MNPFLENLKKSVDAGEFNSEAAKKIIEITNLADIKANGKSLEEIREVVDKRLEIATQSGVNSVSAEEAVVFNSEYEKKMKDIKKEDTINQQIVTLVEMDDMINASIMDVLSYIIEVEDKFKKEVDSDLKYKDLFAKLEEIKNKYSIIINN